MKGQYLDLYRLLGLGERNMTLSIGPDGKAIIRPRWYAVKVEVGGTVVHQYRSKGAP
jgi:hypothetical protein